jgi:hypothetical protein
MTSIHQVGALVVNPLKPEWGPGKVLEQSGSQVTVYFRDCSERAIRTIETQIVELEPAPISSDPFLDNLPPYSGDQRTKFKKRVTLADGLEKFRHYFPKLFDDPIYLGLEGHCERGYKWVAHELYQDQLGAGRGCQLLQSGELGEVRERLLRVESHLNLLSPYEKMALRDALNVDDLAAPFYSALFDVIEADAVEREVFERLVQTVENLPVEAGKARVATWPVLTQFPFIARPDCHMFLKPEVTRACADRMLFDLNYKAKLNWLTYKQLLVLSDALFEVLSPLGARDYIDVQSFIWVIGAYD